MALLSLVPLLSVWLVLVGLYEHLHAVGTDDSNLFGAADDSAAFGAYPPPGAALCFGRLGCARLAAARCFAFVASAEHIGPCQPLTHLYILPAHEDNEVQQLFGGACDCPAVFSVVLHRQAVRFRLRLEALVVVDAIIRGVFDTVLQIVLMYHLVEKCCGCFFDWSVKSS